MSFTLYPAIDLKGGEVVRLKRGEIALSAAGDSVRVIELA